MKRLIGSVLLALFALSVVAGPAAASHTPADVGVFGGVAKVGKAPGDGCLNPAGAGLGLPILAGDKNGYWAISTTDSIPNVGPGFLITVGHGAGNLTACGKLTKVPLTPHGSNTNGGVVVGAACGISKGFDGVGRADFPGTANDIDLINLGWKTSVGGTLPVIGNTNPGPGTVVALTQAQGGQDCLSKSINPLAHKPSKSGGATRFTVVGVFVVVAGVEVNPNETPVTCKSDTDPTCWYPQKKND